MVAGRGHTGAKWRAIVQAFRSQDYLVCGICGQPIDRLVKYPDPWSFSVDMIQPWSKGGDPHDIKNLRASHRFCNTSRGAGRTPRGNARDSRRKNRDLPEHRPRRWTSSDQP